MRSKVTHAFLTVVFLVGVVFTIAVSVPTKPAECRRCGATGKFMMSDDPAMTFITEAPDTPSWVCCNCGKIVRRALSAMVGK